MPATPRHPPAGSRARLLALAASVVLLFGAGSLGIYGWSSSVISDQHGFRLEEQVVATRDKAEARLVEAISTLRAWASQPAMIRILDGDPDGEIQTLLEVVSEHHEFLDEVTCVTWEGRVIASTDMSQLGQRRRPPASEIGDHTGRVESSGTSVVFEVPIVWQFDERELLGVLRATGEVAALLDPPVELHSALLDTDDRVVVRTDPASEAGTANDVDYAPGRDPAEFVTSRQRVRLPEGVIGAGWTVVVGEHPEQLYTALAVFRRGFAAMTVVSTLLILILMTTYSRRQARMETAKQALEMQLDQSRRLEAVGQLAAGVAHEINTPAQYVTDNVRFLQDSLGQILEALSVYQKLLAAVETGPVPPELIHGVSESCDQEELEFLAEEVPGALKACLEGLEAISAIVKAMKEFAHPELEGKKNVDLNSALQSVLMMSRSAWKDVAEVVLELDPSLPEVPCLPGELNQVFLNLLINSAHAIEDAQPDGDLELGTITIRTLHEGDWVEVQVADTGIGMPEEVQARIFEPFYTTKEVGRGSGQGLAISHAIVVEKHQGTISCQSEPGRGTTLFVRLPLASG